MDDLILRGGIVGGAPQDLAIREGRIREIRPGIATPAGATLDIAGKLVLPGFVESHIHPDKAFVADRSPGLGRGGPTAQVLVADYGLREGARADLVVLDAADAAQAITEQSEKLWVLKAGRVVARNTRTTELGSEIARESG